LIALALVCSTLQLLPGTARMGNRAIWKSRHNQAQFSNWAQALSRLGWELSPKEFENGLWKIEQRYQAIQRPTARALAPLGNQLGMGQSWRMFANPQTHPARLHIDLDRGAGWQPLYVSRSDEHDWRRAQFDHNRTRKLIGRLVRKGRRRTYRYFTNWVANAVRDDFDDARRVRVRMFRWGTPSPAELDGPYDANGRFDSKREITLRGKPPQRQSLEGTSRR
jgi:hypothetical protein